MLFDITRPYDRETLAWPGDPPFERRAALSHAGGDGVEVSRIALSCHCGTHLAAPRHFFPDGRTLDAWPIERLRMPATVIEVDPAVRRIGAEWIDGKAIDCGSAVLFKTGNGTLPRDRFREEHAALEPEIANRLVDLGVALVGIDYLSVDVFEAQDFPVHRILLGAGVLTLEDVDLRGVAPGRYRLWCFPLRLADADGAPCRAVLETE